MNQATRKRLAVFLGDITEVIEGKKRSAFFRDPGSSGKGRRCEIGIVVIFGGVFAHGRTRLADAYRVVELPPGNASTRAKIVFNAVLSDFKGEAWPEYDRGDLAEV